MMRTAMYVQYVPMPKLAQPKAKLKPSAWRGVASRHTIEQRGVRQRREPELLERRERERQHAPATMQSR